MAVKSTMARALMVVLMIVLMLAGGSTALYAQSLDAAEPMLSAQTFDLSVPAVHAWPLETVKPIAPTAWSAPALRLSLTTAFVGLQALDVATTLHGVRSGNAVEANPLMGGLTKSPAAFVAVKGALTAATVASLHNLSRTHPKAAVLTMVALNAASAFVVRSNIQIALNR